MDLTTESVYAVDQGRYLFTAAAELEKRTESKSDAYEVVDEIPSGSTARALPTA